MVEHRHVCAHVSGVRCATHGDYRLDNVLITVDGTVRLMVVDWQTAGVGCGQDVAYFRARDAAGVRRATSATCCISRRAIGLRRPRHPYERLWRDYTWYSRGLCDGVVASMLVVQTPRATCSDQASRHGQRFRSAAPAGGVKASAWREAFFHRRIVRHSTSGFRRSQSP